MAFLWLVGLMAVMSTCCCKGNAQFTSCHSAPGCSGNVVTGPTTAEECCLSATGTHFNDGSMCQQCVVFGWITSRFTAPEAGTPYTLEIGYLKGTGTNVLVNIEEVPGGTATLDSDFRFEDLTTNILIRPGDANRAQWRITLATDSIAQEPDESFQLRLVRSQFSPPLPTGPNVFFSDIISLTIQDTTEISFFFTQQDYEELEEVGFIPVTIEKNQQLATPVTLVLTPYTVARAEEENMMNGRPIPPNLNEGENDNDDPFSPNRAKESDFNTQPINVTFEADEGAPINRRTVKVGVTMDDIDEASSELFVAILEVRDALSLSLITDNGFRAAILRITDDDDVEIGYELSQYTLYEPPSAATDPITYNEVRIIKSIVTEETLFFGITVSPIEATQQTDNADNDFNVEGSRLNFIHRTFNPSDQDLTVTIEIYPDMVLETVERFRLGIISAPGSGDLTYLTGVTLVDTTTVSIINNFVFVIGLDPVSLFVTEDQGYTELCVRILVPPDDVTIPSTTRFTMTPVTVEGSAGNSDYSQLFPASVLLDFDNANRVQCFNVTINDDGVNENTEQFSVQITTLGPRPDNLRFDPEIANISILEAFTVGVGTCEPVIAIANGRVMYSMRPDFPTGTVATYTCNNGYNLEGSSMRVCAIAEGAGSESFIGVEPRCVPVCGELPTIANGSISYGSDGSPPFSLNTVATYSCNTGYRFVLNSDQDVTRTCVDGGTNRGGNFDGMAPSCELTPPISDRFTNCHDAPGCSGNVVTGPTTVRECCLSATGTHFNDGSSCQQCVVFGWLTTEMTAQERGAPYTLEIGYRKGTGPNLLVNIEVVPNGTATLGSDFRLDLTTNIFIQPGDANQVDWIITLATDSVAQEPDELFQLQLVRSQFSQPIPAGPNVFFIDTISLTIRDKTEISFFFTQQDYEGVEGVGSISVTIEKSQQLATPVTLLLTPLTVMRAEEKNAMNGRHLPPDLNEGENADDNSFSPNRAKEFDFDTQPINVTFGADESAPDNRQIVGVGVTMDEIDEASSELFVVSFEVIQALNQTLISQRFQAAILRITDDDDVEIGYEYSEYMLDEPAPGATDPITYGMNVRIIKSIVTEQTLLFGIIVSSIEATQQTDTATNDFNVEGSTSNFIQRTFNPRDQDLTVTIDIFPDMVLESVERFRLGISVPNAGDLSYLTGVTLADTTTVSIVDNFVFVIGLEPVSQSVDETQGYVELCVHMTDPPDDVSIPPSVRFTVTPVTVEKNAGNSDYGQLFPASVLLDFNNENRAQPQCFNITINDDNVYENTEQFSVQLTTLGPRPDNLRFEPEVANITIVDTSEVTIGFISSPYSAIEDMETIVFMVGVIGDTILDRDVVVSFSTVDGSIPGSMAVAGSDYRETSVSLTFNAVTRLLDVEVSLINDDTLEMTENFRAVLSFESGGSGRAITSPMEATANIIDDDIVIIQIRVGRLNCVEYSSTNSLQKIGEISKTLARNTAALCSCGFNSSFLLNSQLQCFEESPQIVTYRTQLTDRTRQFNTTELLSYIEQWIRSSEQLVVNGVRLTFNRSCSLVISSFESEECPSTGSSTATTHSPGSTGEDGGNVSTSNTSAATTHFPSSEDAANIGAIVASVLAGVLFFVLVASVFPLVWCIFCLKKQLQVDERNEIELQGDAGSSVPEYEVVESADVEYEEIDNFRGYSEASQQPHPLKGDYEYTQCPAYGPVNRETS